LPRTGLTLRSSLYRYQLNRNMVGPLVGNIWSEKQGNSKINVLLVFKLVRCSSEFTERLPHFFRLMRKEIGLLMFAAYTWTRFSYFLLVRRVEDISSGNRPLFPIGWKIVQIVRRRQRKMTNTAPTIHSLCDTSRKPIRFIIAQLYSTCD
jgi:hypothetical protein